MLIEVPTRINDTGIENFFKGWVWNRQPTGPVKIDFGMCDFVAPYALTLFSAYYLYLKEVKSKHAEIRYQPKSSVAKYLWDSGFLELVKQGKGEDDPNQEEKIVKLEQIKNSRQIPVFAGKVMKVLDIDDEEISGAIKYALIELLRNVIQHSNSAIGGVAMAHYFPKTGLVEICVADSGVGIKESLSAAYPEIDNDLKALKFATQPHISGTFTAGVYDNMQDNAGLGLFFIKQITSLASGRFFLASGGTMVSIWGDAEGDQQKRFTSAKKKIDGGWHGTFAYLQLTKKSIVEFDQILQNCRYLASESRKYPRELALDFITEIPELEGIFAVNVADFEEDVERAAYIRDNDIIPRMSSGEMIVIDFSGVMFATQSFIHALMYKVIRDGQSIGSTLSVANCSKSTREAVMAVAAYAAKNH